MGLTQQQREEVLTVLFGEHGRPAREMFDGEDRLVLKSDEAMRAYAQTLRERGWTVLQLPAELNAQMGRAEPPRLTVLRAPPPGYRYGPGAPCVDELERDRRAETGGPAFPRPGGYLAWAGDGQGAQPGMTLRQYFAGQAIAGAAERLSDQLETNADEEAGDLSRAAYRLADAMLAAGKAVLLVLVVLAPAASRAASPVVPAELRDVADAVAAHTGRPGGAGKFLDVMFDESIEGQRELAALRSVKDGLYCATLYGLQFILEAHWRLQRAKGPGAARVAERTIPEQRERLRKAGRGRCWDDHDDSKPTAGGAAAERAWLRRGDALGGLWREGGLLERALGADSLIVPGTGFCDMLTGQCAPAPAQVPSARQALVGAAIIVLALVPVPDEVVTWPVLVRLATEGH